MKKEHNKLYKYDSDNLVYIRTNKLLKYRFIVGVLVLSVFLLSFVTAKSKLEIAEKENIIKQKENRIKEITTPLREETYVQDLYKAIGFKLTGEQYKRFSELALKYKYQIEEAKVPATLVWWTAYKESRFNVNAENGTSTAKGMYQFLSGTWNEICKMKGYNVDGRFNEQKQVTVMLDYMNYLYNKHGSWEKSVEEYHGGEYQYPVLFLMK
jgi:hypothetical protein